MATRLGIDPSFVTTLQSFDFGEFITPDGRSHPVDALSPVSFGPAKAAEGVDTVGIAPTVASQPTGPSYTPASAIGNAVTSAVSSMLPSHFGTRAIFALIAVGLILIVAVRLTLE